uniref:NR LBD domain-containing protein n=1 Tax=Angiostrongylus cantonensis TaxID=6313 RepID=A0A0K0D151_ANGCA
MISDPFLALFPSLADQPDVMDQLRTLWNVKLKVMRNKPESEQAASFFQLFMNTAYCVHNTALMPPYRIWDMKTLEIRHQLLKKCEDMLREYRTSTRFLLTEPCLPLNVYDYSFDLLGRHALD